jgi:hypothetical protein
VAGRLASPRFRRRALRVGLLVVAASSAAIVSILFWNTGTVVESPVTGPSDFPTGPSRNVRLSADDRRQAIATARFFVDTAVRREKLDAAYDVVGPGIKQGLSRSEWQTGNIPVVPYPVDVAKWKFDYTYADEIGLEVLVLPQPGSKLRPMVFSLLLRKSDGNGPWLVDSWSPRSAAPSGPTQSAASTGDSGSAIPLPPAGAPKGKVSRVWLLAPLLLISTVILVPLGAMGVERARTRRAERRYDSQTGSRGL